MTTTTLDWIGKALAGARPQTMGALLRYFRNLDVAEEAFQEASLRAIRTWPVKGPPRDPVAWLIFVGRNAALDEVRKTKRQTELPDEDKISDLDDVEGSMVDRLDESHYRDDVLRLLFICCHPDLPATQQIALALRIVSGLTVKEIASAFLVTEAAMEQRITRAKRKVGAGSVEFETPDAEERARRLRTVSAMIYLVFNEGYSASGGEAHIRRPLCEEAIRLARLMLRLFPSDAEVMGLNALLLLQHARAPARLDEDGQIILLDDQDRTRWDRDLIAEGLVLIDKAVRHRAAGPYQLQAAIAAIHAHAATAEDTDWVEIDALYAGLERMQASPVVSLNRSVAVAKLNGPQAALDFIAPLADKLSAYFHYHGVRGNFLMQLGRNDEARDAFGKAISLARTPAEAAHIRQHLDRLGNDAPKPRAKVSTH